MYTQSIYHLLNKIQPFGTVWPSIIAQHGVHLDAKVIYTKYSKHLPNTVAHTIDCVCSKLS